MQYHNLLQISLQIYYLTPQEGRRQEAVEEEFHIKMWGEWPFSLHLGELGVSWSFVMGQYGSILRRLTWWVKF